MTIKLKTWFRLRAGVVVLALALGWLSAPLSLASLEPDVCEMECCIAEGHCCCAEQRAYVKGREPKPGDVSITTETTFTNPCPAGCSSSGISTQNKLPRATHAQAPLIEFVSVPPQIYRDRCLIDHQFAAQHSSPRAPPAFYSLIS